MRNIGRLPRKVDDQIFLRATPGSRTGRCLNYVDTTEPSSQYADPGSLYVHNVATILDQSPLLLYSGRLLLLMRRRRKVHKQVKLEVNTAAALLTDSHWQPGEPTHIQAILQPRSLLHLLLTKLLAVLLK